MTQQNAALVEEAAAAAGALEEQAQKLKNVVSVFTLGGEDGRRAAVPAPVHAAPKLAMSSPRPAPARAAARPASARPPVVRKSREAALVRPQLSAPACPAGLARGRRLGGVLIVPDHRSKQALDCSHGGDRMP